jgi:hypothetical protein
MSRRLRTAVANPPPRVIWLRRRSEALVQRLWGCTCGEIRALATAPDFPLRRVGESFAARYFVIVAEVDAWFADNDRRVRATTTTATHLEGGVFADRRRRRHAK